MYSIPPKILSKLLSSPSCDSRIGPQGTPETHETLRRKSLICKTLYSRSNFVYPLIALFMLAKHNFSNCDFSPRKNPLQWNTQPALLGTQELTGCASEVSNQAVSEIQLGGWSAFVAKWQHPSCPGATRNLGKMYGRNFERRHHPFQLLAATQ